MKLSPMRCFIAFSLFATAIHSPLAHAMEDTEAMVEKTPDEKLRDALFDIWDRNPEDTAPYLEAIDQALANGADIYEPVPASDQRYYNNQGYPLIAAVLIRPAILPPVRRFARVKRDSNVFDLHKTILQKLLGAQELHEYPVMVSSKPDAAHPSVTIMQTPFYVNFHPDSVEEPFALISLKELVARGAQANQKNSDGETTIHFLFKIAHNVTPLDASVEDATYATNNLKNRLSLLKSAYPNKESFLEQVCTSDLKKPLTKAPWNNHSLATLPMHPMLSMLADNILESCTPWKKEMGIKALTLIGPRTLGHNYIVCRPIRRSPNVLSKDLAAYVTSFAGAEAIARCAFKKNYKRSKKCTLEETPLRVHPIHANTLLLSRQFGTSSSPLKPASVRNPFRPSAFPKSQPGPAQAYYLYQQLMQSPSCSPKN